MKVRMKYSKQGLMKFIGHLDMMRSFQKLLRRTGFDVVFSEGYSPHMVMSYAFPLGVGMTSDSEYVDVDLGSAPSSVEMVRKLNESAPEGVHFLDARQIQAGKMNKGMALVARADYTLAFRPGHEWPDAWKEEFQSWVRQPSIIAEKSGKKGTKEIDIAPLIYKAETQPEIRRIKGIADADDEGQLREGALRLALSAKAGATVRPELVMDTFSKACGYQEDPFRFMINRDEVYADQGQFIPLIELGTRIG